MSETFGDATDIIQSILSSQNQENVPEIELQLVSRALQHLDLNGVPYPIAITVAPTPLKLQDYTTLTSLQPYLNTALDKLSKDKDTMTHYLNPVAECDPFVRGFLDIYRSLPDEHFRKTTLALSRHDFMFDNTDQLKLVEFNLVAASSGCLGEGVFNYHQTVLRRHCVDTSQHNHRVNIVRGCNEGISLAYELYNRQYNSTGERKSVVVMVNQSNVSDNQFNYFDQQLTLNDLERMGVPTIRYTAQYLADHGYTGPDGRYFVDDKEVAVFYFRTLYDPSHFVSPEIWRFRRDVELSAAITVPCVRHQLVNAKLFQMVLCERSILDRYSPNSDITDQILKFFCETLHLNLNEEGDKHAQLGINQPEDYVLKPQREGGGNNIWEDEMKNKLLSLSGNPARAQYILMRRIRPHTRKNKIIKRGVMSDLVDTVTEFGCFSVYCADETGRVLQNEVVGPLVRTKLAGENEGGVVVGIAAIDSPYFVRELER